MKLPVNTLQNEEGFVLVTALLIMVVLTIIGIAATTNTSIELQIAGNDKVRKTTFYQADAGGILGSEILEQSFSCPVGFAKTSTVDTVDVADLDGTVVRVYDRDNNLTLWQNEKFEDLTGIGDISMADVAYPVANIASGVDVGYIYYGGSTQMLPGGALQMAAGYEGKGKSAGQGGTAKIFDLYSQFRGLINSETIIMFGWRHLVGSEGDCYFD
jgi:hypothetical protein